MANRTEHLKEGAKYDTGKPRYDLLPPEAILEITQVLTFGANKYADRNWEKGIKYGRVVRAALGHIFSWWSGEKTDAETGLSHLAHAGCCILFLLTYEKRGMGKDWDERNAKTGP